MQTKQPKPGLRTDGSDAEPAADYLSAGLSSPQAEHTDVDSLKFSAILSIGCGILLMFLGSAFAQRTEVGPLAPSLICLGGFAWAIWGCVNYMIWKGYSGWLGMLGYLLLPGLLVLLCLPNQRKRRLQKHAAAQLGESEEFSKAAHRPGPRFLLTLVPVGVLCIGLVGFFVWARSSIDAAQWKQLAPPGIGFQALMPGTPRVEQQTKETPSGKVELHKFTVKPLGKKEYFMVVSLHFPEGVSQQLGGTDKLLELGRQDVVSASQGQLKREDPITLDGSRGLQLELLTPSGAIVRARVYARKNQIYEVSVYVPKILLPSADVAKFFDSFELLADPAASPGPGGR